MFDRAALVAPSLDTTPILDFKCGSVIYSVLSGNFLLHTAALAIVSFFSHLLVTCWLLRSPLQISHSNYSVATASFSLFRARIIRDPSLGIQIHLEVIKGRCPLYWKFRASRKLHSKISSCRAVKTKDRDTRPASNVFNELIQACNVVIGLVCRNRRLTWRDLWKVCPYTYTSAREVYQHPTAWRCCRLRAISAVQKAALDATLLERSQRVNESTATLLHRPTERLSIA